MAITAFTSTAIIDATTIGTTVLTASTEGIAADAIGLGTTDDVTFNSVGCVDGSFAGSLTSEVGGYYKLYNLGTEGDADSEYFGISWSGNTCSLGNYATGTGSATRSLTLDNVAKINIYGVSAMRFTSSAVTLWKSMYPQGSNISIGTSGTRFKNYFGQNGDFSGDVLMAANVDFTGLPTADPLVASRLWNDSGTMKISAG